jgi:para-nitrobenzyl esterase
MSGYINLNAVSKGEDYYDETPDTSQFSSRERICRLMINDGTASGYEDARKRLDINETTDMAGVAAYLRSKSVNEILKAYQTDSGTFREIIVPTYRDGTVFPDAEYTDQISDPSAYPGFSHVPILLSTTLEETKLFSSVNPDLVTGFRANDPVYYTKLNRYETMSWKYLGVDRLAPLFRTQTGDVYAYRFDWDEEGTKLGIDLSVLLGAFHGSDIPFIFGDFSGQWKRLLVKFGNAAGRKTLSDTMISYLVEFMRTGRPGNGSDGLPVEWTSWDGSPGGAKYIIFDTNSEQGTGVRMSPDDVTKSKILQSLAAETDLTLQKKCDIFNAMAAAGVLIDPSGGTLVEPGDLGTFEGYLGDTCP